jgi:hypothetical protein
MQQALTFVSDSAPTVRFSSPQVNWFGPMPASIERFFHSRKMRLRAVKKAGIENRFAAHCRTRSVRLWPTTAQTKLTIMTDRL